MTFRSILRNIKISAAKVGIIPAERFIAWPCPGGVYPDYKALRQHQYRVKKIHVNGEETYLGFTDYPLAFSKKYGDMEFREYGSICPDCYAAWQRLKMLYKDGNEQIGWTLSYGVHNGFMVSREQAPSIRHLSSFDECRQRVIKIKEWVNRSGSHVWFATAISPDGESTQMKDLSEYYR